MIVNKEELTLIAEQLADEIEAPAFICLQGELGVGKTFFCSAFIKHLTQKLATSPTYTIMNEYSSHKGKILHVDAYRLSEADADILKDYEDYIILLEWPEKIGNLPNNRIDITIKYSEEMRDINVDFRN